MPKEELGLHKHEPKVYSDDYEADKEFCVPFKESLIGTQRLDHLAINLGIYQRRRSRQGDFGALLNHISESRRPLAPKHSKKTRLGSVPAVLSDARIIRHQTIEL